MKAFVNESCIGCTACTGVCPVSTIAMDGGKAVVGASCIGCSACVGVCPVGAIAMQ